MCMQAREQHPIAQIAVGLVIGFVGVGVPWACSGAQGLSPVMACRLRSLDILPEDPMQATVYDAVDIIERLRACERVSADGGL